MMVSDRRSGKAARDPTAPRDGSGDELDSERTKVGSVAKGSGTGGDIEVAMVGDQVRILRKRVTTMPGVLLE